MFSIAKTNPQRVIWFKFETIAELAFRGTFFTGRYIRFWLFTLEGM